jgi:hypothetical protein
MKRVLIVLAAIVSKLSERLALVLRLAIVFQDCATTAGFASMEQRAHSFVLLAACYTVFVRLSRPLRLEFWESRQGLGVTSRFGSECT